MSLERKIKHQYAILIKAVCPTYPCIRDTRFLPLPSNEIIANIDKAIESTQHSRIRNKLGAVIIRERFGLDTGTGKNLEELGVIHNITRERVRQIEAKALRMLRRPPRVKTFLPRGKNYRVAIARNDLYDKLRKIYPPHTAFIVAKRVPEESLRGAFKSTEIALVASCGINIQHCLHCGNPLPPGWEFCNIHCRAKWKIITVVCSRCGREFQRHQGQVIGKRNSYCSIECRNKRKNCQASQKPAPKDKPEND